MKKFKNILLVPAILVLAFSSSVNVFASEGSNGGEEAIDEMWGTPTFVYGSALSESQVGETKSLLTISGETTDLKVTGEDMVRLKDAWTEL